MDLEEGRSEEIVVVMEEETAEVIVVVMVIVELVSTELDMERLEGLVEEESELVIV